MPVKTHGMTNASCKHFRAAAVEIDAADLRVRVGWHTVVTRLADLDVEFVVWSDRDELPAMRLVLGQIGIDHRRFRRLVEIVLDLLNLGDLGKLRDVERAVL